MEYDLHNNVNDVLALAISSITTNTTTVGAIIDTAGYESIEFVIQSGTLTDGTYTVTLEDGDDAALADAATITSTYLLGTFPSFIATEDDTVKRIGTNTKKRYVRLSIVSTGVTTGGTMAATAVQGHPHRAPVA